MKSEIKKRVIDLFQQVDDATLSEEDAATFLATVAACVGFYLSNNFTKDVHDDILENFVEGAKQFAKSNQNGFHIHITVIEGKKK